MSQREPPMPTFSGPVGNGQGHHNPGTWREAGARGLLLARRGHGYVPKGEWTASGALCREGNILTTAGSVRFGNGTKGNGNCAGRAKQSRQGHKDPGRAPPLRLQKERVNWTAGWTRTQSGRPRGGMTSSPGTCGYTGDRIFMTAIRGRTTCRTASPRTQNYRAQHVSGNIAAKPEVERSASSAATAQGQRRHGSLRRPTPPEATAPHL